MNGIHKNNEDTFNKITPNPFMFPRSKIATFIQFYTPNF